MPPDPIGDRMVTAGPVRYQVVELERADATYGLVGALWIAVDGSGAGLLLLPD